MKKWIMAAIFILFAAFAIDIVPRAYAGGWRPGADKCAADSQTSFFCGLKAYQEAVAKFGTLQPIPGTPYSTTVFAPGTGPGTPTFNAYQAERKTACMKAAGC